MNDDNVMQQLKHSYTKHTGTNLNMDVSWTQVTTQLASQALSTGTLARASRRQVRHMMEFIMHHWLGGMWTVVSV